jgi:hypothetical protein
MGDGNRGRLRWNNQFHLHDLRRRVARQYLGLSSSGAYGRVGSCRTWPRASGVSHLPQAQIDAGRGPLGECPVLHCEVAQRHNAGFDRIVELRLKPVSVASRELSRAKDDLSALLDQRGQTTISNGRTRDELRRGISQRDDSIVGLTTQLGREAEIHQKNLEGIREACRLIRGQCILPRSQAEDTRYAGEVGRLSDDLARQREERKQLQVQIDGLVRGDAQDAANLDRKIGTATVAVNEARQTLRRAADGNQVYRLAASWYRVNTSDVTPEQFATARLVFATFSAIAVALAGTVAALVYYARSRVPGTSSLFGSLMAKVARARRAYYARRRKPIVREVPGPERVIYRDGKEPPVIVKTPVDRLIDHIVLIPRWGIWNPTYINSLIRSGKRNVADHDDPNDSASNVTQLKTKVN